MLINWLEYHARQQPDATALVSSQRSWTWGDYRHAVALFAEELRGAGVRRLALALDNGPVWAIADLACLQAGVVCIPVPLFFSPEQCAWLRASSGAEAQLGGDVLAGWQTTETSLGSLQVQRQSALPELHAGTVKITYTSGTTGMPKGVCLTRKGINWTATTLAEVMKPFAVTRHMVTLPLSTLLENICGCYVPLVLGVTSVMPCAAEVGFSGSSQFNSQIFTESLLRWHPQSLVLVPELLRVLLFVQRSEPAAVDPLKFVATGGGKISSALLQAAAQSGLPVFEGYGLSECGSVVTLNLPQRQKVGSAGYPLPGVSLSFSAAGDLQVVSPGNAAGYLGEPAFTAPFSTGDLAEQDSSGFIHIRGRQRNVQINAFGRNFSPEWIEAEAMGCTAIRRMVIFGEGLKHNVALVDAYDGMEQSAQAQLAALAARLPDYARPHHLLFTPFISSPQALTANGRPRREVIWKKMQQQILTFEEES